MSAKPTRNIPLSVPEISGNEWSYVKDCIDNFLIRLIPNLLDISVTSGLSLNLSNIIGNIFSAKYDSFSIKLLGKIFPILNVATGLVSVIPMRSLLTMESVKTVGLAKTTRII